MGGFAVAIGVADPDEKLDAPVEGVFEENVELSEQIAVDIETIDKLLPIFLQKVLNCCSIVVELFLVLLKYSLVNFQILAPISCGKAREVPPLVKGIFD